MTQKMLRIQDNFNFSIKEQTYCTPETIKRVESMGLPVKDCAINDVFVNANEADYHRRMYCIKNCCFKCKSL